MSSIYYNKPTETLTYEIGVLNYEFDNSNDNVRLYKSKAERDTSLVLKIQKKNQVYNVPFIENVKLSIPFQFDNTIVENILNYNYCIIKTVENNYYYYFIDSTIQNAGSQVTLNLTLDPIQTYYYDCKFPLATIHNAHLDRFIEKEGVYTFDNSISSKLLTNDLQDAPKFAEYRDKLYPLFDTSSQYSPVNDLCIEQNINWLYVFVNPKQDLVELKNLTNVKDGFDMGYILLCAPIYNYFDEFEPPIIPNRFYLANNEKPEYPNLWDAGGLIERFKDKSNFILNMKVSPIPPFNAFEMKEGVDWDYFEGEQEKGIVLNIPHIYYPDTQKNWNCIIAQNANTSEVNFLFPALNPSYYNLDILKEFSFSQNDIIDKENNLKLEPALLSEKITELHITDFSTGNFVYDIQKIGKREIKILFSENFFLDISKSYVRYEGDYNTTYQELVANNLTGLVCANDTSIPFDIDQLQTFLANNKNFFQIKNNERSYNWTKILKDAMVGLGLALTTDGMGAILGALGGTIVGSTSVMMENNLSLKQQNLTIDNMRKAPDSIKNASGSYLFNMLTDPMGTKLNFYVENYEAIEQDKLKAFWKLFMNGYPLNIVDNPKNYDSSRIGFNYIKADIQVIDCPISNLIKNMIKKIFAKGVRFWHMDTINYDISNHEVTISKKYEVLNVQEK